MLKNIVEPGRPQMTVCSMRVAFRIPKATNTHTVCVILIAFPLQQWLHERASMLCYTYVNCLVNTSITYIFNNHHCQLYFLIKIQLAMMIVENIHYILKKNSLTNTVFLLLMRATCSTIFISKCKLKISNMPTQNASYTYNIIKIHFKTQNFKR